MGHKNSVYFFTALTKSPDKLDSEQRPHQKFAKNSHLKEFESESSVYSDLQVLVSPFSEKSFRF